MTDSSSNEMADIAAELLEAKMESAKKEGKLTHVLKIGTFHMEIVPDADMDIEKMFNQTLSLLMEKYDERLLNINITQLGKEGANVHYG